MSLVHLFLAHGLGYFWWVAGRGGAGESAWEVFVGSPGLAREVVSQGGRVWGNFATVEGAVEFLSTRVEGWGGRAQ